MTATNIFKYLNQTHISLRDNRHLILITFSLVLNLLRYFPKTSDVRFVKAMEIMFLLTAREEIILFQFSNSYSCHERHSFPPNFLPNKQFKSLQVFISIALYCVKSRVSGGRCLSLHWFHLFIECMLLTANKAKSALLQ